MGRISLYEVLKRQGKVEEVTNTLKTHEKPLNYLQTTLNCSPAAAKKLLDELNITKTDAPVEKTHKTKTVKLTPESKQRWCVCTGPLRGTYIRPDDVGHDEEYKDISLFLGCIAAETEQEAIDKAFEKYGCEKLKSKLDKLTLIAIKAAQ